MSIMGIVLELILVTCSIIGYIKDVKKEKTEVKNKQTQQNLYSFMCRDFVIVYNIFKYVGVDDHVDPQIDIE